jgi:leucyl aminopeptidase
MSWHRAGYPAIFAAEGDPFKTFNPYIHTSADRMDLADGEFSFEVRYFSLMYVTSSLTMECKQHALEFAKVAVGFVVELGGWVE